MNAKNKIQPILSRSIKLKLTSNQSIFAPISIVLLWKSKNKKLLELSFPTLKQQQIYELRNNYKKEVLLNGITTDIEKNNIWESNNKNKRKWFKRKVTGDGPLSPSITDLKEKKRKKREERQ